MSPTYPEVAQAAVYAELDELAASLDAEVAVFHSTVGDPRPLPPSLRRRLGDGIFAPQHPMLHSNDVEHFRHTAPQRCDGLMTTLAGLGDRSAAALYVMPEVQAAFSFARWAQGWHADVVCSHGLGEVSFHALVTAHLLQLPRFVFVSDVDVTREFALLLPLHVQQAAAIVPGSRSVAADLVARFGDGLRERIARAASGPDAGPSVRDLALRAFSAPRAADAPARGPQAAFRTRRTSNEVAGRQLAGSGGDNGGARPFLVLGAERTGSNLLVDMLSRCPGFACANELFNPRLIDKDDLQWLHDPDDRKELLRLRRASPPALLARLLRDGAAAGADHVGFKLIYLQGLVDDRILDHLAGDDRLTIVHLLRGDRLRRWLSITRARETDQWFSLAAPATAAVQTGPMQLDVQATAMDFTLVDLFEGRYRALFERHAVAEVDYDEFTRDLAGAAKRLGALFGRELGEFTPRTVKTGIRDLERGIGNLDELRDAFAHTRWAPLFDGAAP